MRDSKNYIVLLLLILFNCAISFAQTDPCVSTDVCFTVEDGETTVCTGKLVVFKQCENWSSVRYNFGGKIGRIDDPTIKSITYYEPGVYKVYQIGNNICNDWDSIGPLTITVLEPTEPTFTINSCTSRSLKVLITDNKYEKYSIDWEADGTIDITINKGDPAVSPPTKLLAGNYTLKVYGSLPANCLVETVRPYTVFETVQKATISIVKTDIPNQIDLTFENLRSYLNYEVRLKKQGGGYVKIADLTKDNGNYSPTFPINDFEGAPLDLSNNIYCVQLVSKDPCEQEVFDEVCTIKARAEALFDQNKVDWEVETSDNFTSFLVLKDESIIQSSLPPNVRSSIDDQVKCNVEYCYQLIGRKSSATIYSNIACVLGKSDDIPVAVENMTASVTDENKVEISWRIPEWESIQEYSLFKNPETSKELIFKGQNRSFTDETTDPGKSRDCYTISYHDYCSNHSPESIKACPILLKGNSINQNQNKLEWSNYEGWQDGVLSYELQILDDQNTVTDSKPLGLENKYQDTEERKLQWIRYRIKAIGNEGLVSFSNIVEIKQKFVIVLPNAFSPNNDGNNDTFQPIGNFILSRKVQIFNKWGELIFEGDSWDGNGKRGQAPNGVYIYYIELESEAGDKFSKRGTLTLIR